MKARREKMMDEVLIIDSADAPRKSFYSIDEILTAIREGKHTPLMIDESQHFWYKPSYYPSMRINPNLWMEECNDIER